MRSSNEARSETQPAGVSPEVARQLAHQLDHSAVLSFVSQARRYFFRRSCGSGGAVVASTWPRPAAFATFSNAKAIPTSLPSSHARPINWMLIGWPWLLYPAGKATVGIPLAALGVSRRPKLPLLPPPSFRLMSLRSPG